MNRSVNNQTRLYISVAAQPGNFGASIFNALFDHYAINAVYVPRTAPSAKLLTSAIRSLGVAGCSVSMPLKSSVIRHLDALSCESRATGSVNTIVNTDGVLTGHNTDFQGCLAVLARHPVPSVLVYGSGSVVNSVVFALREAGVREIWLAGRSPERVRTKARSLRIRTLDEAGRSSISVGLLVNATPSGDDVGDDIRTLLPLCASLFDLRVRPDPSPLERAAAELGLQTIPGVEMAKFQLQKQMELYTGICPPIELLEALIEKKYSRTPDLKPLVKVAP